MPAKNPLLNMTPEKFETYVLGILKREKVAPREFEVTHLESVEGMDGAYKMDVVATFVTFGEAQFKVLVECKRHSNPIEREVVMLLQQKLTSTGSHKGMIFSTSAFQSGAVEFALAHGIALVHVQWGKKRVFVTNQRSDADILESTEDVKLLESWTAELMTQKGTEPFPYLGRPDVCPSEILKTYFGLDGGDRGGS